MRKKRRGDLKLIRKGSDAFVSDIKGFNGCKKNTRILFLLEHAIYKAMGGSELQAYYLCREFKKGAYEIHYAFNSNINLQINDDKIFYHFLHDHRSLFCWFNVFSLMELLKQINPDIIYQRCRFAYTGIAAYYAKKNSIKMIYNVASDNDCRKNKIPINKAFIPNIINEYTERYGIKNANIIIAQTYHQQKLLKQNFNRDSIVIPNGHPVPLPPFKKTNPAIIAWIANIKQLKQPEIFIKLAEKCQDLNAQFIYGGRPANGEYQNMLIRETKKLDNLNYLGEIPFAKTNELLSKASIFVNTSTYEGFPNPYIQAWMRETPVVGLNVDPDDILKRYEIGFHSGNFAQLVKDIRYLVENEDVRKKMGKRAREYAVEHHDIERIGKRYLEVFEELVKK